jgi:hypothetical protein
MDALFTETLPMGYVGPGTTPTHCRIFHKGHRRWEFIAAFFEMCLKGASVNAVTAMGCIDDIVNAEEKNEGFVLIYG